MMGRGTTVKSRDKVTTTTQMVHGTQVSGGMMHKMVRGCSTCPTGIDSRVNFRTDNELAKVCTTMGLVTSMRGSIEAINVMGMVNLYYSMEITIQEVGLLYMYIHKEWANGSKNGRGWYEFSNGDSYEGFFQDGCRQGRGAYQWKTGGQYNGQWNADKMDGDAELVSGDGTHLTAKFIDDRLVE